MKEALLYNTQEDNITACFLCSHRCRIADGRIGLCGARQNRSGKLYSLVYGKIIASQIDPIEKKPLFHVLPGTRTYSLAAPGCNFQCGFCQNWNISQIKTDKNGSIPGRELLPDEAVNQALSTGCRSIAYTYTEPTVFFEYAYDTASKARDKGLKNIFVTNGYQTSETIDLMAGLIDAANVDLKSFSDDFYSSICKARLKPVLDAIEKMHQAGIWLEITTLVIPGQNDSDQELKKIAGFLAGISTDIPWHISRYHPDYQMTEGVSTSMAVLTRAREIGLKAGLKYVYIGNAPGSGFENTVCPRCQQTVIERRGYSINKLSLKSNNCANCGNQLPILT